VGSFRVRIKPRKRNVRLAAFCIGVTLSCAATDAASDCPRQAEPGSNWIVFSSFRGGDFASSVHAVLPDGSGECRISAHPSGLPNAVDSNVSPDGTRIAFVRGGDGTHRTSVWTMHVDGSGETLLAENVIVRFRNGRAAPVWSPDGRQIAFVADASGARIIRVMNADGSEVRDLGRGTLPAWAPDGSRIVFENELGSDGATAVWTMRPDGSDRKKLTDDVHSAYPSWSPDSATIIFSRQEGEWFDLFLMKPDGTDLRALTSTPDRSEIYPRWSPDGRHIAFTAKPADAPSGWERSIYVLPAAGGKARQVTPSKSNDISPSWLVVPE
jgi:TolB protein